MPRQEISTSTLYSILQTEFKKRRPRDCISCRIPLPFRVARPDAVSANWHIGTPTECPHHCDVVIAELLAELWTHYDLIDTVTSKA